MNRGRAHESGGERKDKQGVTILWHVLQSAPPQPITTKLPLFSASVRAEGILARAEMTAREGQKERKKEKEGERQREREPNQAYISPFVSPLPIPHVNVSLPLRC